MYMKLLTSNRYYGLNDGTINLLMKGDIDMSALYVKGQQISVSGAEVVSIIVQETEVDYLYVIKIKPGLGVHSFHI